VTHQSGKQEVENGSARNIPTYSGLQDYSKRTNSSNLALEPIISIPNLWKSGIPYHTG